MKRYRAIVFLSGVVCGCLAAPCTTSAIRYAASDPAEVVDIATNVIDVQRRCALRMLNNTDTIMRLAHYVRGHTQSGPAVPFCPVCGDLERDRRGLPLFGGGCPPISPPARLPATLPQVRSDVTEIGENATRVLVGLSLQNDALNSLLRKLSSD